jgi:hypothetical protein
MKLHQTDKLPLETIGVDRITSYLIKRGWKQVPFPREGLLVFEGPEDDDGRPIVQVIPRSEQSSDFDLRAAELVRTLSVIEDRSVEEILHDIREAEVSPPGTRDPARPGVRTPNQRAAPSAKPVGDLVIGYPADQFVGPVPGFDEDRYIRSAQRAPLLSASTFFWVVLLLLISAGILQVSLAGYSSASLLVLVTVCTSAVLAGIAGSMLFVNRIESDPFETDGAIRELRQREADLAAEVRRLRLDLARIGQGATHPEGALTRAFALSLVESIKHGDEWLRIKSIGSLAELAGADQIVDVAEPVLVGAAGDDESSQAVRAAAVKALGRFRENK